MNLIFVARFPLDQDLSKLSQKLTADGVVHRFTEEAGQQVFWVVDSVDQTYLKQVLETFFNLKNNGGRKDESQRSTRQGSAGDEQQDVNEAPISNGSDSIVRALAIFVLTYPIVFLILCFGLTGYLLVEFFPKAKITSYLYFHPPRFLMETGQYWRAITPAFLHFGIFHIVFNSLWVYDFGKRIERYGGSKTCFILFFATAMGANFLQYLIGKHLSFGGLSGVVYGLVGFLWMTGHYLHHPQLKIQSNLLVALLVFLVLGFTEIFKIIGISMANWAHLGGLLAGCAMAFVLEAKHTSDNRIERD